MSPKQIAHVSINSKMLECITRTMTITVKGTNSKQQQLNNSLTIPGIVLFRVEYKTRQEQTVALLVR